MHNRAWWPFPLGYELCHGARHVINLLQGPYRLARGPLPRPTFPPDFKTASLPALSTFLRRVRRARNLHAKNKKWSREGRCGLARPSPGLPSSLLRRPVLGKQVPMGQAQLAAPLPGSEEGLRGAWQAWVVLPLPPAPSFLPSCSVPWIFCVPLGSGDTSEKRADTAWSSESPWPGGQRRAPHSCVVRTQRKYKVSGHPCLGSSGGSLWDLGVI